jgi:hypothetical protein
VFLPYFPFNLKMKLRLEVFFKKFHPRIDLTTFFLTKSYLLNTIKPFSGHENRYLTKSQKTFRGTLRNLNFKILSIQDIKLVQKALGAKISALKVLWSRL